MPSLGGIQAWITIGDSKLEEVAVEVNDDEAVCYVEVPHVAGPTSPSPSTPSSPLDYQQRHPLTSLSEYAINWKISDMTYTLVVKAVIDGALEAEKISLGRGSITNIKNTGRIDAVPITDDWSKRRLLHFVKLQASESSTALSKDSGSIKLLFYRAGRASIAGGMKTSASGFHKESPIDPSSLPRETTVDGLFSHSHATGLGPITFGPSKKVPSVGLRDEHPYVTFVFLYRSRELISELAPEEWTLAVPPPPADFDKELPAVQKPDERSSNGPPPSLTKRPSMAARAQRWASEVKQTAKSVRIVRERPDTESAPPEAISDAFTPKPHVIPRTSVEGADHEVPVLEQSVAEPEDSVEEVQVASSSGAQ